MENNTAQQNIPSGWKQVALGDLISVTTGKRDANHGSSDGQYPFFTCAQKVSKIDNFAFDTEAVLIAGNGDFNVKYYNGKFDAYQRTYVLSGFKDTTGSFVYQKAKQALNEIIKNNQGSSVKFIKIGDITDYPLLLPPINEQQKIAEILGTVDEDIAITQEVIEATGKLKCGLMQQLFARGIGHTKFKETKIGQIPEGWELVKMKGVCTVRQGLQIAISQRFPEYKERRYKYITLKSIKEDIYDYIESPKQSVICTKDDVLMTRTGNTGVVVTDREGVFHNNFFLIDFDRSRVLKNYLVYYFLREDIKKIVLEKAGTTTIPDLNHDAFYGIDFVIPNLKEQKEIAEILSAVDEKISVNKKLKEKLTLLKKGLMQDLLSGNKRTT